MDALAQENPEPSAISTDIFLSVIFGGKNDDEHILLARQTSLGGGFRHAPFPSTTVNRWLGSKKPNAVYFNVSTVKRPNPDDGGSIYWRRRKQDCISAYVVVLDDIGSKVKDQPPLAPSYKLESSAGNFQWGYLIQPCEDLERYAAIVDALGELGFTDKGAGGYNRVMRVPGSINIKPGRNNFISIITEWEPDRLFGIDDVAIGLGVDLDNLEVVKAGAVKSIVAGGKMVETVVKDPMLEWLAQEGHVVEDSGNDWVTVTCPWHDEHTTGTTTAGYSPLGRGEHGWRETRAFNCLHEHCKDRHLNELRNWVVKFGGPDVKGHDPLPLLQASNMGFPGSTQEPADNLEVMPPLSLGSDVEIASAVLRVLENEHGKLEYDGSSFCQWIQTHWVPITDREIERSIHQFDGVHYPSGNGMARLKLNKTRILSIKHIMRSLKDDDFFSEAPVGVNTEGGFIQIKDDGRVIQRLHDPDFRQRHLISGTFQIDLLETYFLGSKLHTLLSGTWRGDPEINEKCDQVQELAGAILSGCMRHLSNPLMFVFLGETAENGKSSMLDVFRGMCPKDATTAISADKLNDEKYQAALNGILLNACDELTSASAIASDVMKKLVTFNEITARAPYKEPVTFKPQAVHVYATNNLPSVRGGFDRGVRRRLAVLKFNRTIPAEERIPDIGVKIVEEEADLLLTWAIEGACRLMLNGSFTMPPSSERALRDWMLGADPVLAWLHTANNVEFQANAERINPTKVYQAFLKWAEAEGYRRELIPAPNNFSQRLYAADSRIKHGRDGRHRWISGIQILEQWQLADLPPEFGGASS